VQTDEVLTAGTQLKLAGNAEEGMAYYHEAVAICSSYAPAFYNIAVVYSEAGRAEVGPSDVCHVQAGARNVDMFVVLTEHQ
jgi:hypothetical protein